jgi:ABC-2 type transport system permease protein
VVDGKTVVKDGIEYPLFKMYNISDYYNDSKIQKIAGYILNQKLVVNVSSMETTIIKTFLDQYKQNESTMIQVLEENNYGIDVSNIAIQKDYTKEVRNTYSNPDSTVNYFCNLIAMVCIYAGVWGIKEIRDLLSSQSSRAARLNLAPINKLKVIVSNLCATILVNCITIGIVLAYLVFVLKVNFGDRIGLVALTSFIGMITGIMVGSLVGVLVKKDGTKEPIFISITMFGCFLSGMMFHSMKYLVQKHVPILSYINPVNLITDACYALYYYRTYYKFLLDIAVLIAISIIALIIIFLRVRREQYENI